MFEPLGRYGQTATHGQQLTERIDFLLSCHPTVFKHGHVVLAVREEDRLPGEGVRPLPALPPRPLRPVRPHAPGRRVRPRPDCEYCVDEVAMRNFAHVALYWLLVQSAVFHVVLGYL